MKKKIITMILTALSLAAVLTGCGDSYSSSSSYSGKSNSYGGYSKEYWDAARNAWDANT